MQWEIQLQRWERQWCSVLKRITREIHSRNTVARNEKQIWICELQFERNAKEWWCQVPTNTQRNSQRNSLEKCTWEIHLRNTLKKKLKTKIEEKNWRQKLKRKIEEKNWRNTVYKEMTNNGAQ